MFEQKLLDVLDKDRANFFNWRGQFTPQFVEYILNQFYTKNSVVLDPFSGSGTVLLESAYKNLECYGIELNPAAFYMSRFYSFCNKDLNFRLHLIEKLGEIISKSIEKYSKLPIHLSEIKDYRESYIYFLEYSKELLNIINNEELKILLLNLLFKVEKFSRLNIIDAFRKAYKDIKTYLLQLPVSKNEIKSFLGDARNVNLFFNNKVDLVITSPPYINVFNYHQNHRAIIELLNYKILDIANSEFGSNRKNRGNRYKTVVQYCLDIEEILVSLNKLMKNNAKAIFVIGRESRVRGVSFYNGEIVRDIIETGNRFEINNNSSRSFHNKFGNKIIEDIIVFTKKSGVSHKSVALDVANSQLEKALKNKLTPNIKSDIEYVIENINTIKSSPLYYF